MAKPTSPEWQSGHALATDCEGFWTLHEGTGTTAADISPNSRDGTLSSATNWGTDGTHGNVWQGDGTGYINLGDLLDNAGISNTTVFSMMILVKQPTGLADGTTILGCDTDVFVVRATGATSTALFEAYDNSFDVIRSPESTFFDGSWHWVWVTYNGTTCRLYVDGSEVGTGSAETETLQTTHTDFYLGIAAGDTGASSNLEIGAFGIWSATISSSAISDQYSDPWGLVEASGVSVTPSAGTVTLTSTEPTVTGGSVSVTPSAGTVTLTSTAPTVAGGSVSVTPSAGTVSLTSTAPTVTESGNVTASAVFSVTTGPAPLCVFCDLSGSTDSSTSFPFLELHYELDWDDSTYSPVGDNATFGGVQAHIYSEPGTYTVTGYVRNPVTGDYDTVEQEITVTDPDTQWATTDTICISTSGTFTGAPTGATQVTTSDFETAIGYVDTDKRVLFRRGETWTASGGAEATFDTAGGSDWGQIGAFGTGDDPVIQPTGSITNVLTVEGSRWAIRDLNIQCGGDSQYGIAQASNRTISQMLVYNVTVDNATDTGIEFSTAVADYFEFVMYSKMCIAYCTITNCTYDDVFWGGDHIALIGNTFGQTTGSHTLRQGYSYKTFIWRNSFVQATAGGKQAIKLHHSTSASVAARESVGSYNVLAKNTSDLYHNWGWTIGPQNDVLNEAVENVLIEANTFNRLADYPWEVVCMARKMMLRNNVVHFQSQAGSISGSRGCFMTYRWGAEPIPQDQYFINNTLVLDEDTASTTEIYLHQIESSTTPGNNPIVRNNVAACVTGTSTKITVVGSASGTTASNNIDADTAHGMVDISGGDYRPDTGSGLIDAGTSVYVYQDFSGTIRTGTFDIGAYDAGASNPVNVTPSAGTVSLTSTAPTVTGGAISITPSAGVLTLTGTSPSIAIPGTGTGQTATSFGLGWW